MQLLQIVQPKYTAPVSGTLISIWQSFDLGNVFQSAVCAGVGTVVSFLVTAGLRRIFKRKREGEWEKVE